MKLTLDQKFILNIVATFAGLILLVVVGVIGVEYMFISTAGPDLDTECLLELLFGING